MMFREIHEVKEEEKVDNEKAMNWMNIKPETNMTTNEVDGFWAMEFQKLAEAED